MKIQFSKFKLNFAALAIAVLTLNLAAQSNATKNDGNVKPNEIDQRVFGRWQSESEVLEIRPDGVMTATKTHVPFEIVNSTIRANGENGLVEYPFEFNGDKLVLTFNEKDKIAYTRLPMTTVEPPNGSIRADLTSNWCYSTESKKGKERQTEKRCFAFDENGYFKYSSESRTEKKSGGETESSSSKQKSGGLWRASATTLFLYFYGKEVPQTLRLVVDSASPGTRKDSKTNAKTLRLDDNLYVQSFGTIEF